MDPTGSDPSLSGASSSPNPRQKQKQNQPEQAAQADGTKRTVSRRACLNCRERKIKCDGIEVCRNCKQLNLECVFVKSHRGGRRSRTKPKEGPVNPSTVEFAVTTATSSPIAPTSAFTFLQADRSASAPFPLETPLVPIPLSQQRTLEPIVASAHSTYFSHPSPVEYPPYAFVQYRPSPENEVSSPPQQKYTSLNALPYARPAKRQKPVPPVINDEDTRRSAIAELQNQIDDLQRQVSNLKQASDYPNGLTESSLNRWWRVDRNDLRAADLPSMEIVTYFIDLYYEYYHPTHCFLLPKESMLRRFSLKTDVGLLHAMFSISCRYAQIDPAKCEDLDISAYLKDPMYWLSRFEKHRSTLYSTLLIKCLLIASITHVLNNDSQMSLRVVQEASQLCQWYSLEKRFRSSAEMVERAGDSSAQSLNTEELLLRESHLRTIWELWKVQVQIALIEDNPDLIPPFNGDLGLPVSDVVYANEFRDWDRKRNFWRDIDADLLTAYNEAEQTNFVTMLFDSSLQDVESTLYCGSAMYIVCANLLALVFKHHKSFTAPFLRTLDIRLKVLYGKLPAKDTVRLEGSFLMAHGCLVSATLLMHIGRASPFMMFQHKGGPTPESHYSIKSRSSTNEFLLSEKPFDACKSYLLCQWAADWFYKIATGNQINPSPATCSYIWQHFSPLTGFLVEIIIPIVATELILQAASMKIGIPIGNHYTDSLSGYPSLALLTAPQSMSAESTPLGPDRDTPIDLEAPLKQPLGWYGNQNAFLEKLSIYVSVTEVMGAMWPKIKNYYEIAKYVKKQAESFL